jgi:hypothetical protein
MDISLGSLFDTNFMPHAACLRTPSLVWIHAAADGLISLAYFLIPVALLQLARRRSDVPFQWMLFLFAIFIVSCGATHVLDVITLWTPIYRFQALSKIVTAMASLATATLFIRSVPKFAAMPSLSQWEHANQILKAEITQRAGAERALTSLTAELEDRVKSRTAELKETNARLRELTSALDLAHGFIRGQDGTVTFWCHGSEELYGWTKEEAIGRNAHQLLKTKFPAAPADIESELERRGAWQGELTHTTKTGTRILVATHWAIQQGSAGQTSVVEINNDISDRLRADEISRELAAIVDSSNDAIVSTDLNGTIKSWNRSAESLLGYSAAEMVGNSIEQLIPPRLRQDQRRISTLVAAGSGAQRYESVRLAKEGREIPVAVTVSPIRNSANVVVGTSNSIHDISAIKAQKDAVRLLEEQLQQAQKMETIGRLAGGIAHDFNNLLTVINGYAQILLARFEKDDGVKTIVENILGSGQRAARLTSQLLAFSRKQVLQPKVLNTNALLESMKPMLKRLIREDIEIVWRLQDSSGCIMIDPLQMEQVIMNLAINARDAMPDGGLFTIETSAKRLDESYCRLHPYVTPGEYAVIELTDTGHGISPEIIKRVFDPFFTTKELGSGTGLGLATVYGIIKQSGGHIDVSSEVGFGSRFCVHLPKVGEDGIACEEEEAIAVEVKGNETILLVEDDQGVREIAAGILRGAGFRLLEAADSPEAILVAEQHRGEIDLLLTDIVMPKLNGRELAKALARVRSDMKVLFMSGYPENAITEDGVLEAGVNLLPKPFSPGELLRKVRFVLSTSKKAKTILVLDDEEAIGTLFAETLTAAGYDASSCRDAKAAITLMKQRAIDLFITDLVMPDQEGIETISIMRKKYPDVPILAISGYGGEYLRVAHLLGASGTLEKPVDLGALCNKVKSIIGE